MKNLDTKPIATSGILIILSLIVLFHLLIMLRVLPFEIVWGGRLKDSAQMLSFETISVIINLLMIAAVGINAGMMKVKINRTIIRIALWVMFALFLLNTIGNMFSSNELEKIVFTPLTLLLSIFSLRLAISKDHESVC